MGMSGDFLPRTLSKWHEHGFDPKHVQADNLRVVEHHIFFCAPPFFGFVSTWHETMWHVWSLMTKSSVHAPLLHKGETKNKKGSAAYVTKAHEMSSQLCLRECSSWNDGEPLARSSIKTHRTRKLSKRNPRGGGREEGEGEGVQSAPPISLFYHILSLDVMRFFHLFHHSNIALRVCILLVYCWCATVYVMTWHTGQYHMKSHEWKVS